MSNRLHDFARAVAVRQQQAEADAEAALDVDQGTMEAIARELGMSDDDIVAARAEGQAHQERARGLRQRGLFDEAIGELDQAHAWNPLDVSVTTQLADTLVRRGRAQRRPDDYERALRLCQQVLRAAPANSEAPALMQTMKMNPIASSSSGNNTLLVVGVAAAAIVLAVVGALAFLLF